MLDYFTHEALEALWVRLTKSMESELAEEFLELLLRFMQLAFLVSPAYQRNLDNFRGRYQFRDDSGKVTVGVVFKDGRMAVREGTIGAPDVLVRFRNGRALVNFLLAPKQDVLDAMLTHELRTEGNLNYLYKFGYLAKTLQRSMTGA